MLDLAQVRISAATTLEHFDAFITELTAAQASAVPGEHVLGFDTEGDGVDYPAALVGFSLYSRPLQQAIYVPIEHAVGPNLPWADVQPRLQKLFDENEAIAHGWQYDGPILARRGIKLRKTRDSLVLAHTLQAKQAGLKDQVLEYRMVDWRSVKQYLDIMAAVLGVSRPVLEAQIKENPRAASFAQVDVSNPAQPHQDGVIYAAQDAIWSRELYARQVEEHNGRVGDPVSAQFIRDANDLTTGLLAEAAGHGYLADQAILAKYASDVEHLVNEEERALLSQLRADLGWRDLDTTQAPAPTLFGVVGESIG